MGYTPLLPKVINSSKSTNLLIFIPFAKPRRGIAAAGGEGLLEDNYPAFIPLSWGAFRRLGSRTILPHNINELSSLHGFFRGFRRQITSISGKGNSHKIHNCGVNFLLTSDIFH
jgi:hypothetical protein